MDYKGPQLEAPVSGGDYQKATSDKARTPSGAKARSTFIQNVSSLFGFRRKTTTPDALLQKTARDNLEFTRVDPDSLNRIIQGKAAKILHKPLSEKLEKLFDAWLTDTTDTYQSLLDRQKLISELDFAVTNDPFLSYVVEMYGHEATQIDVQNTLIQVDCADLRMKKRMGELLEEWGVTQNRVYSVITNLAQYGDSFWAHKIDMKKGVRRIIPISVRQITERLEFDPVEVSANLSRNEMYMSLISRDSKLQILLDTMESTVSNEFADLFDKKLFGFVTEGNVVAPPWSVTHFRLGVDHSEFAPFGKSLIIRALAPFRQCNATMVLQSLARVMSFPITVYEVGITPGMDESQVFEKVNEVREQYENIGETGGNSESYSVNTKLWVPEGLVKVDVHSPNIDLNAIGDIEMYQDRVAIASGIPKGYLVQEWGGYSNSAISLVEQFKPFARRVFTLQSAFLEGLSNLFRLHFAITGEFDYRENFVLSMKFPNEEASQERMQAKEANLSLSTKVIDAISGIVASLGDPLSPEIVQDILSKYSFLDPKDVKKWIKPVEKPADDESEQDMDSEGLDSGGGGGFGSGGDLGSEDGMEEPDVSEGGELGGDEELGMEEPGDGEAGLDAEGGISFDDAGSEDGMDEPAVDESPDEEEDLKSKGDYQKIPAAFKSSKARIREINKRYFSARSKIHEAVMDSVAADLDEATLNNRHYKFTRVDEDDALFKTMEKIRKGESVSEERLHEALSSLGFNPIEEEHPEGSWGKMKRFEESADDMHADDKKISDVLSETRDN